MRALKVLLGVLVVSVAIVASIGADAQPPPPSDLEFLVVKTRGVESISNIEVFSRLSPPVRIGDILIYDGQRFVVYWTRVTLITNRLVYHEIWADARTDRNSYGGNALAMRPTPSRWRLDETTKRFVLMNAEGN